MGPVASQEAIKMLGTNGGGFFNANSSHPFENPTALTNFVQMLAIFLIPAALCFAFGDVVNDRRQGRTLLWAMSLIFVVCVALVMWAEWSGNRTSCSWPTAISIWKVKRAALAFSPAACMRWSPRRPPAVRSTPCMTPLPRWAA
jgi:K+-transporting ATPase ATPase A chain